MARFNTWLPDNLIDAIKAKSDETGVPQARIVRRAIEAHLEIKGVDKPMGPQPAIPDMTPRKNPPKFRGQVRRETSAEAPQKRDKELSDRVILEEKIEEFSTGLDKSTCSMGFNIHACNVERPCVACKKKGHYGE